jgi:hypothetical protein
MSTKYADNTSAVPDQSNVTEGMSSQVNTGIELLFLGPDGIADTRRADARASFSDSAPPASVRIESSNYLDGGYGWVITVCESSARILS